jgi:hypothetical protein
MTGEPAIAPISATSAIATQASIVNAKD